MIGIVNYGIGNLRSVANALAASGIDHALVSEPEEIVGFDKIVVPGVGSFGACMEALISRGFKAPVLAHVAAGKPLLGICVGMQMLADRGTEFGSHQGLGLIPGDVVRISQPSEEIRLPHVGWSALTVLNDCPILKDLPEETSAYFVHSYHFAAADVANVSAVVDYGSRVTAAVSRGNIFGVQFHPEKSQMVGLRVLKNFAAL